MPGQDIVTGKVVDTETKKPIKNADVVVRGTTVTTRTNFSGYFQLTIDSIRDLIITNPEYDTGYITVGKELKFQAGLTMRGMIYTTVDKEAEFIGGIEALSKFIGTTFEVSIRCKKERR